ncbi:hypothetical protein [Sporosarcina sp. FSL K6-1508]|uniref:hypothetical protein n=1 Tax=Sporosarcina sp. FSL K6-1508 TaxID=2921553 RepID=UPI0030F93F62
MNLQSIINEYKARFKMDPLLNRIRNEGLEDKLFANEDYYSKISFSDSYSTTQAVEHLSIEGNQTIINYVTRNDLKKYLAVSKRGRFYRYDWISLFKFKMIFLLNENDFTPMDIAEIIGTRVETSIEESSDYKESEFKKAGASQQDAGTSMENLLHTLSTFETYKEQQALLVSKRDNYTIDLKLREERIWSIQGRLDDMQGYLSFMQVSNTVKEDSSPGGLLGWLFKSKDPNYELKQEKLKIELNAFEEKKKKLHEAIETAKDEKNTILLNIRDISDELDKLKQTAATLSNLSNSSLISTEKGVKEYGLSTKIIDTN